MNNALKAKLTSIDVVKNAMIKKGYTWFEDGAYNLNLIGIRAANGTVNKFDDIMTCTYRTSASQPLQMKIWTLTTDPGLDWLKSPMNSKGTGIMVPGQYRSSWKIGKHHGEYDALVQSKPIKVYRDADRDGELDMLPETIDEGIFGVNIHHATSKGESTVVGKWSAACQVFANITEYNTFMGLVNKASKLWGVNFSYTLLNESDLG